MENFNAVLANDKTLFNLPIPMLVEEALKNGEGVLTNRGALSVVTGKYTGRSPDDKFIVRDTTTRDIINWGNVNQPMSPESFQVLYEDVLTYMKDRKIYVFDGFAGADPAYRLSIRVFNELAWQNLFIHQLLIRPGRDELKKYIADFHIISVPGFKADPARHGTNSEAVIALNLEKRILIIGSTLYAGEIKKTVFTLMNYILPRKDVLSMHCSANLGPNNDTALFFGLSGTGKTTLSADPTRRLIGDDEHGWSDNGIFNVEGGCYAKCIGLDPDDEPQIFNALKFGSVLENVIINEKTRVPDLSSDKLTENTRAGFPIDYIPDVVMPGMSTHPKVIFFLTADAFGVLPPIALLNEEQARYHFLSGYTSKLAGTERGIVAPEATFSECFGAPFLPLNPTFYADLLVERIKKHKTRVYLINTGWTGGPYGVGHRFKIAHTRAIISGALDGTLERIPYKKDPIFGFLVPAEFPGIPQETLNPSLTWPDTSDYEAKARELLERFQSNYKKFDSAL